VKVIVQLSFDAALWGWYVTKAGSWTWLEDGRVQLEINYDEANRVLGLTGMTERGASELVNALELGVFEAEKRNGEVKAPQNRLQEELNGAQR
jgi:hypothetical protein